MFGLPKRKEQPPAEDIGRMQAMLDQGMKDLVSEIFKVRGSTHGSDDLGHIIQSIADRACNNGNAFKNLFAKNYPETYARLLDDSVSQVRGRIASALEAKISEYR